MQRKLCLAVVFCLIASAATITSGQVVINEVVYDDHTSTDDVREFVELYNAGDTTVNMSFWLLASDGEQGLVSYDIPDGTSLAAGDYYVIGATGTSNLDFDIGTVELFNDANDAIVLRDISFNMVDAFLYEANKQNFIPVPPDIAAETGRGWWGNTQNQLGGGAPASLSRWMDGRDTDNNARDFGILPITPGTSNMALPVNTNYSIPDADAMAIGEHTGSSPFVGPWRGTFVIDPTVAGPVDSVPNRYGSFSNINPRATPASPNGGNAFMVYDPWGGGNLTTSEELVTSFEISAYLDTAPYGAEGAESTTYGLGTSGTFYRFPDPTGLLLADDVPTENGNVGVGWVFEKEDSADIISLHLVDFGEGGNSSPDTTTPQDWSIITTIDMHNMSSDWYTLSIELDGSGNVSAKFGDQEFNFTTDPDLLGTFYVGYRESVFAIDEFSFDKLRPPTFDLVSIGPRFDEADFDRDGDVDGDDFLRWQTGFGTTSSAEKIDGDYDNDGDVDGDDFLGWQAEFGNGDGSSSTVVPEPASVLLLLASTLGLLTRRRRLGSRTSGFPA